MGVVGKKLPHVRLESSVAEINVVPSDAKFALQRNWLHGPRPASNL